MEWEPVSLVIMMTILVDQLIEENYQLRQKLEEARRELIAMVVLQQVDFVQSNC
jgi:hypothetical protein